MSSHGRTAPLHVVVASDKFKGSLSAAQVAQALGRGLGHSAPDARVTRVPVADGGDGTLAAALDAGFERCPVTVTGPTGSPVDTAYARRGDTAVVELADASGLVRLVDGPAPLSASTLGTGQVVGAAVDAGCRDIVLGVGGSSSTDGGAGLVVGLGARVLDRAGAPVPAGAAGLRGAASLDLEPLRARLVGIRVTLASDVDNPLLGPEGAATVYGSQKGATAADLPVLEDALHHWADLVAAGTGQDLRHLPGAGAAGGAGFAALSLLGARMRSGIETVLALTGFDAAVTGADLVVTGEGSLDEQSLRGKAPVGVLRAATRLGVPVVAVCGRTTLSREDLLSAGFVRTWALADREPDLSRSIERAAALLEDVGRELGLALPTLVGDVSAERRR